MKVVIFIIPLLLVIAICLYLYERNCFGAWIKDGHRKIKSFTEIESSVDLESLPPLLQSYLNKVLVQKPIGSFVYFNQIGDFRMNPEDKMSKFSAEQVASVVSPMFSWVASIRMGGLSITVCDRLIDGQGELQARLLSSILLAKGTGDAFLRGELLRYLAELPWYPMAILNQPGITWVQKDENKIAGTLSMKSVTATVEYTFDEKDLIQSIFVHDREMSNSKTIERKPWLGEFSQYEERDGVIIPIQGQVSWLLDSGKFTYFVGQITTYRAGTN